MPSFLFRPQMNSSPAKSIHPTHLNQRPRCAIDVLIRDSASRQERGN